MTVLDVGCGVGKPARQIATFTGCKVVGLNNNEYQVERATAHAVREKLDGRVGFVGGDFMVSLLGQSDGRTLLLTLAPKENQFPARLLRRSLRDRSNRPRSLPRRRLLADLPRPETRRRLWGLRVGDDGRLRRH
jgi:SAM-dependent methyltransferase